MRTPKLAAAIIAVSALALTACSSGTSASSSSGAAQTLNLGWTPGVASPQIPVAQDSGYWKDEGLTVNTSSFNSGRDALTSLLGGGIDVAILSELPVVTAALAGSKVTVVDNLSTYGSYRIIGSKKAGITSDISSLAGKKVATTTGTNMQFLTDQALSSANVKADVQNVGVPDIVTALTRGDVDAGVMFDSFYGAAQSALGDNYVEIPVPATTYTGNMLVAVSTDALKNKPQAIQALVDGLSKASDSVVKDPEAAQAALLKVATSQTAERLAAQSEGYDYQPTLGSDLTAQMVREGDWVKAQGTVGSGVTVNDELFKNYIDDSFLTKASK